MVITHHPILSPWPTSVFNTLLVSQKNLFFFFCPKVEAKNTLKVFYSKIPKAFLNTRITFTAAKYTVEALTYEPGEAEQILERTDSH